MLVFTHLIAIIYIGVGLLITACNRYRLGGVPSVEGKDVGTTKIEQGEKPLDRSKLFEVDEHGKTLFCKAIEAGNYKKLRLLLSTLLREIEHLKTISYDVVCLITGYKLNKQDNKQYPKRALLDQVLTSYNGEVLGYTCTEELLDILFQILYKYGFDLEQAFLQKYGVDQNTIMHLAVNTANLSIIISLKWWYLTAPNTGFDSLMQVCSMPNKRGISPLFIVTKMIYHPLLACAKQHAYDLECERCDHQIEMRIRGEEIVLYLLKLGVPIEELLHYVAEYGDGYFMIEIMETIQKREINNYTPQDLASLKDQQEDSLLFYAVLCRDYKLVDYLLALGACPMYFNKKGLCPLFLAVAFRDVDMVKKLLQVPCILERRCNVHQQSSNGLKALDVAMSSDGCGMRPVLENYSNNFKREYNKQIVPNGWNWSVNPDIVQQISDRCNYFEANAVQKAPHSKLFFHDKLYNKLELRKRKFADFEIVYSLNTSIGTSKPPKAPMLSYSLASWLSSSDPNGGG
ncbi:ankyrin repeat domain-containing protein [Cardinium endosymbiont of Philonthus spinipes]|uniref:ankyrin repeat domain-containing protein n=1 Tax=Cardinium endosymbiont of Philonthus spinipes TaxID=3077941 RepID=UPI00313C49EC